MLIINADDCGRDRVTTDRILDCIRCGTVSGVSAMVFMQDSERASCLARERGVDTGLHLNLTTEFSRQGLRSALRDHQERVARYLKASRWAQAIFHPGLAQSFAYLVAAQLEEFQRLYGTAVGRVDGHHHMHLSANVILQQLLPLGARVRKNFSFAAGEKNILNRLYRGMLDMHLARRHVLTDFFFSLPPLQPARIQKMFVLSTDSEIEVECHPVRTAEYNFLSQGEIFRYADEGIRIAQGFPHRSILSR